MAVLDDGSAVVGELSSVTGAQTTSNKTVGANSNRALYFWLLVAATAPPTVSAVNWNTNETMTVLTGFPILTPTGFGRLYCFRLLNPTAATANISFTLSATADEVTYVIVSKHGVDQTTPEGTVRTATGTTNVTCAIGLDAGSSGGVAMGCGVFSPAAGTANIASRTAVPYYISVGTASSSAGATSITPTGAPATRLLGDMEFASVATENNNAISVSGTGWAQVGSTVQQDATWQQAIFARRYNGTNVDPAFSWTGSVGCSARRWIFRDVTHAATFIGFHATNSGSTSTHSITGQNSTANNSDVMYLSHAEANTALGADADYTERFDAGSATGPYRLVVGDRTQATSGAGAANFSATGAAASWVMRLLEMLAGTAQTHLGEVEHSSTFWGMAVADEPSQTFNSIGFTSTSTMADVGSAGFNINPAATVTTAELAALRPQNMPVFMKARVAVSGMKPPNLLNN
jgi:hypothetical protein